MPCSASDVYFLVFCRHGMSTLRILALLHLFHQVDLEFFLKMPSRLGILGTKKQHICPKNINAFCIRSAFYFMFKPCLQLKVFTNILIQVKKEYFLTNYPLTQIVFVNLDKPLTLCEALCKHIQNKNV